MTRLRLLSMPQLGRAHFPGRSQTVVGRAARRLVAAGFVTTWDELVVAGGRPRYIAATGAGLTWALAALRRESAGKPWERLVSLMAPTTARQALRLEPGKSPPFLAHQRECNHLLLSFQADPTFRVLWASSWDRPFPSELGGIPLPQPDYVLVVDVGGTPHLVFGEHDRGMESLAHFKAAKVDRYSALATLPDFCERTVGFRDFSVWVTTEDFKSHPVHRLKLLMDVARRGGMGPVALFSLAGWAYGYPGSAVWFTTGTAFSSASNALHGHDPATLVAPFSGQTDSVT